MCVFFNFNPRTNECVLNFGWLYQSNVNVNSGGGYIDLFMFFKLSPARPTLLGDFETWLYEKEPGEETTSWEKFSQLRPITFI